MKKVIIAIFVFLFVFGFFILNLTKNKSKQELVVQPAPVIPTNIINRCESFYQTVCKNTKSSEEKRECLFQNYNRLDANCFAQISNGIEKMLKEISICSNSEIISNDCSRFNNLTVTNKKEWRRAIVSFQCRNDLKKSCNLENWQKSFECLSQIMDKIESKCSDALILTTKLNP